jgi:hypothetical protein
MKLSDGQLKFIIEMIEKKSNRYKPNNKKELKK